VVTALGYLQVFAVYIAMLLLGHGGVYLLSFGKHAANPIYQIFVIVTNPVLKLTRLITPKQVADKHLPLVAFLVMFWVYFGLAIFIPMLVKA
jgi:uncharacterized protein YggT (Ycf19 family)